VRQYANTHFDKVAGIVLVDPSGDNQRALWRAAIPKHSSDPRWTFNEENWRRCMTVLRGALLPRSDPALKDCTGNDADTVDATLSSLHAMEHASAAQLAASRRSYGDLPLIVLSAGIDGGKNLPPEFDDGERAAFDNVWADLHRDQASLSTIGERRIVPGAGHGIQTDAPQAVIDAIREVLAAASTR
jgi:pimeloyl-ACP methyl ester carboxylesterase